MNYRFILGFCLLGMLCNPALAAKVYTWTDAEGVTHYGEHPPKDVAAKIINARTGHSEPVPTPTPPTTEEAQVQPQTESTAESTEETPKAQPRKDPERCDIARKNLETLNGNARIRMPDGDGNMRLLSAEEREGKLAEMEKAIEESCE